MKQKFIEKNYEIVEFSELADIYVVNTCTVTNMSDRKSRNIIRRAKQTNPHSILVAVGCYAQVAKKELEKIEEIDLILGNNEKNDIVEWVEKCAKEVEMQITDVSKQTEYLDFGKVIYSEKTRAVIKIQDGCDRFCSYCIIPYARGRVRSRKKENIVEEINSIIQQGIKEVVITGIHIASYGKDFKQEYRLIDLLEDINQIPALKRIRLGSIEPTIITKDFVERLVKLDKICDHFHLSLQSGCDDTLKRMNRKYTTKEFEEGVKLLKEAYPNVALTTDIIVGFPGETEKEFEMTYEFLKKIDFYKMHIFKYSKRKGTKAALMPNQIEASKQEERSQKLIALSDQSQKHHNERYINQKLEVLLEEQEGEYRKGHTTNYIVVYVKNENTKENTIKTIQITDTLKEGLIGEISKENKCNNFVK